MDIGQAIKHFYQLRRDNPDWPYNYCLAKVANLHKLDIGLVASSVAKNRMKKPKRITKKSKIKVKRGKDDYPENTPWWVKY